MAELKPMEVIMRIDFVAYDREQICAHAERVQELIRCKDCRWGKEVCGNIECFVDTNVPPEYHGYEWFCPNGGRRADG